MNSHCDCSRVGDGDGFAIGNRSYDPWPCVVVVTWTSPICVMDNPRLYGLTKGQDIATFEKMGLLRLPLPDGSIRRERSRQWRAALISGATFVAQSFSSDIKDLTATIVKLEFSIKDSQSLMCTVLA